MLVVLCCVVLGCVGLCWVVLMEYEDSSSKIMYVALLN